MAITHVVSITTVFTLAAVATSSFENNTGSFQAVFIATVSNSTVITASSSVNNTGSVPGLREQTPASSNAQASIYSIALSCFLCVSLLRRVIFFSV